MKKFITIPLFVTLCLFVSGFDACNKAIVSIPQTTVTKGEIARVPVYLANGDECKGMQTDLCIDGGYLKLVGCEAADRTKGWYVTCNEYVSGCSRVLIVPNFVITTVEEQISYQRTSLSQGNGAVVNMLYQVALDAPNDCFRTVVMNSKVANMDNDYMEIDSEVGMGICIK